MKPTIAVTGATGFIGAVLTRRFIKSGYPVVALVRTPPGHAEAGMTSRRYDLRDRELSPDLLSGADILLHAAMQAPAAQDDAAATNVRAARELLACARACGVRKRIFISSFSARSDARSAYGKQKHAVEALFSEPFDAVVRPGLVIGNGGLFRRLAEDLRTRRIVPLIGGGIQPLQTIHLEDLCAALESIISQDMHGVFNLAEPEAISYKAFQAELCARLGVKPFFIPVPFAAAHLALAIGEALRLPMPINRDNLLGLKAMRSRETNRDSAKLGISVRTARESLDATLLPSSASAGAA